MLKKIGLILAFIFSFSYILFSSSMYKAIQESKIINKAGTFESGRIEAGLVVTDTGELIKNIMVTYTNEGKPIVSEDEYIYTYDGDIIKNTMYLKYAMNETIRYQLIVMKDFVQTDFFIDGKQYLIYDIELDGNGELKLDIEVERNDEEIDEVQYLIVRAVEDRFKTESLRCEPLKHVQDSYGITFDWRVNLNNTPKLEESEFEEFDKKRKVDKGIGRVKVIDRVDRENFYEDILLHNTWKDVFIKQPNQDIDLMLGNIFDNERKYVVVQLLDNKQIAFADGDMYKYFKLEGNEVGVYALDLPKVDELSFYQVLVFDLDNIEPIEHSSRVVVKSEQD